jgi:hypothetical protein
MVEFEGKKEEPKNYETKDHHKEILGIHDARCNMMITMMLQMFSISSVLYLDIICH